MAVIAMVINIFLKEDLKRINTKDKEEVLRDIDEVVD